jgi:hypothetical protein
MGNTKCLPREESRAMIDTDDIRAKEYAMSD